MAKKKGGEKKHGPKKLSAAQRVALGAKKAAQASASTKAGAKEEASQISTMFSIKSWESFKKHVSDDKNMQSVSAHLTELKKVKDTPELRKAPKDKKEIFENDIRMCEILLKINDIVSSSANPTKKLVHELIKDLGAILKKAEKKHIEKACYDLCAATLWKAYNLYETLPSSDVAKEKSEFYKKHHARLEIGSRKFIESQLDSEYHQLVAKEYEQKGDKAGALEAYFNALESITAPYIGRPEEQNAICQNMCITYQTLYHLIDTRDQISRLEDLVLQNKASSSSKDYGFLLCAKAMHDLGDYATALKIVGKISDLNLKNSTILKYQIILAQPIDKGLYTSAQLFCDELLKRDDPISSFFIMQELFETIFLHYTSIRDIEQMLSVYKMLSNSILMQHEIVRFYIAQDDLAKAKEFIEKEKIDLTSINIPTLFKIEAVALYNALGNIESASRINDSLPKHLKQDLTSSDSESDGEETVLADDPDQEAKPQEKEAEAAAADPAPEIVIERPTKKVKFTALDARRIEAEDPENVSPEEYASYYKFKTKMARYASKEEGAAAASALVPSWHIGDSDYVFTEGIFNLGNNIYATIKPGFKFEAMTANQFNNALNKGFVKRAHGENGVKFVGKSAIEVKISSDMRLYTGTKFVNEAGDELLIFDQFGNHGEVKRFADTNKAMAEERVKNVAEDLIATAIATHHDEWGEELDVSALTTEDAPVEAMGAAGEAPM